MITLAGAGSVLRLAAQLEAAGRDLGSAAEHTALAYLEELTSRLRPETPVRTGRMKAGYGVVDSGGGRLALVDQMDYAGYVVFGTSRQAPHQSLLSLLSGADDELTTLLEEAINRRLAAALP